MIVEIRNAGFINKGAELMLYTVVDQVKEKYPDVRLVMAPKPTQPYEEFTKLGFFQHAHLWRYGFQWGRLLCAVPKRLRELYGLVLEREIDVALDASGFCYSDALPMHNTAELANTCKRLKKSGIVIILLPQAFGPFKSQKIRKAMEIIVSHADMIYARERISYKYLTDLVGARPNIKIAPDFTSSIKGVLPDDHDPVNKRFCVIPNKRMLDKTLPEISRAYVPFMISATKYLVDKGCKPFILVHEGEGDLELAYKIRDGIGCDIPVLTETHPLKIKGIIGSSDGVLSCRFHGLVSALSQGVPAMAVGWSHKYQMLFEDYGFPEGMLEVGMGSDELQLKLDLIIDRGSRETVVEALSTRGALLKSQVAAMWEEIFGIIAASKR